MFIGFCVALVAVATNEKNGDFEKTLTDMIERLEKQLDKTQRFDVKLALEAAIESLVRVRFTYASSYKGFEERSSTQIVDQTFQNSGD